MRGMLRNFANVAAVLSLLLCVAVLVLWVRSYWKAEWWSRYPYDVQTHEYGQGIIGSDGGKAVAIAWNYKIDDSSVGQMEARAAKGDFSGRWKKTTFGVLWPTPQHWWERLVYVKTYKDVRRGAPGVGNGVMVVVPHWVLVLLFSIWPAVWSAGWWRKRRRLIEGRCENCGYDLRASPGRCPECGRESQNRAERVNREAVSE
jgi:hypothetical protein